MAYWLGETKPSLESSFFNAMQKYGPLMQLGPPNGHPDVFVKRESVQKVHDTGVVKRLIFKDGSSLEVRYAGPCRDLYDE